MSDALPFGRLWYDTPDNAIGYAMHSSRSHDAVIRIYDDAGNVIDATRAQGRFQRVVSVAARRTKSRNAVKHDGSLLRLVDQLY